MHFASDNSGPVHPAIVEALVRVNEGHAMPYGADAATADAVARIRDLFEAPEAAVHLVATGTAANALLLATMCAPWQTIFCADIAHVAMDECGAPEFFTGGAKLSLVPTEHGLMTPDALETRIAAAAQGVVHSVQRGPVTITSVTECGTVYSPDALRDLTGVAQAHGCAVHLDGARLANAAAALGCSPADMTWKAGVDAVSFGGTKNGLMGAEAAIIFDPALAWQFELRRKRGGHLFSKHRYLGAQMAAYLTDDLWLTMAGSANRAAARLAQAIADLPDARLLHPCQANMVFAEWPRAAHRRALAAGAAYYPAGSLDGPDDEPVAARMVCDWSASDADTDRFVALLRG
ncbi:Low specificity L-threonine aldolase [Oceaniovalibus guishaninsula JLT2003]|uniref:Low specificity L-threonine aldolase n=1 Tax=Oceaniovalibus guishaninsula JLT2003 TaxID=1231392 RepID=K2HC33_9RHOB|nr:beta-eliminating lyase-related protein [Oceaniovalibus guishaninsula]EKE44152.1 Low specificity L-threonine aldolase [Oceaniovalibus guishaninsula JLT2003]